MSAVFTKVGTNNGWSRDRAFGRQDPHGTPAGLLDGHPVDSEVLYDPRAFGDLLRS